MKPSSPDPNVSKANEPLRIIAKLNDNVAHPVYKNGQVIGFEAKHTDADRIERSAVTPHQTFI